MEKYGLGTARALARSLLGALSDGWSRQRVRAQVERTLSGRVPVHEETRVETRAAPMFEAKADRFVIFTKRLATAPTQEHEAGLAELRKPWPTKGRRRDRGRNRRRLRW